ncbi:FRG domain-containing protein [Paenibacillus polysaccharolyticus]|uniref:FRG domain-containing protein n=1 Tax=Paenibacillus polysaccharolyticus TaxID=582692 RepID=UPI00203EF65B|nr:FRG domain-containing protein [Paenibacillus polysaccharolyticus]MCM3134336.1 FRG domain-containing protein [Paenibacillus polysaccharolyticus]
MSNVVHYEVNSVEDYMAMIEELPKGLDRYYYRGENKVYSTQSSSLLRSGIARLLRDNPEYYVDAVNDYVRDMADQAGEWEREHVLAWCHHEGLPTNLLELTASPLRALYFACLSRTDHSEEPSQAGYVYGFARENTADVTELILENVKIKASRYNLIEDMGEDPRWINLLSNHDKKRDSPKPDLAQMPYLIYQAPYKYRGSDEPNGLYFYQFFQTVPSSSSPEFSFEIIQQQYTPALIVKVRNQTEIREHLHHRLGLYK